LASTFLPRCTRHRWAQAVGEVALDGAEQPGRVVADARRWAQPTPGEVGEEPEADAAHCGAA
jgi:hypothetical protein